MSNDHPAYLSGLNNEQKEAVLATDGPLLVVAGAGTGKTRTLTSRIVHLIRDKKVTPESILALTFTNKAAAEMRERVHGMLYGDEGSHLSAWETPMPLMKTFHGHAVWCIREHHTLFGLPKYFQILDRQDSLATLKRAMSKREISPKEWEPKRILSLIGKMKQKCTTQQKFAQSAASELQSITAQLWGDYDRMKREEGVCDFDDLLMYMHDLLSKHPEIRAAYQQQWQYVHVDEYQDTNTIQFEIVKFLVNPETQNICVVGDGDQTIYTWRGATMRNILHFEKDFPGALTVILEQNYRSTAPIIDVSQAIIEKNVTRVPKRLVPQTESGNKITVFKAANERDEASWLIKTIKKMMSEKSMKYHDFAVLMRANYQSRLIEEACLSAGVPYQISGTKFFDRKEVKDTLAYVRYAINSASTGDLARIINIPKRGIGKVSLARIVSGELSMLKGKAAESYQRFEMFMDEIRAYMIDHSPSETITFIAERSGMKDMYLSGGEDDLERWQNIKELVSFAREFDEIEYQQGGEDASVLVDAEKSGEKEGYLTHLDYMLEHITLMSDQDGFKDDEGNNDAIRIMTVHAAKGLEFHTVFVVGLELGIFPSDGGSDKDRDPEEERRLMYVACTRARRELFLSYCQMRTLFGKTSFQEPSPFIYDIPEELVNWEETSTRPRMNTYNRWGNYNKMSRENNSGGGLLDMSGFGSFSSTDDGSSEEDDEEAVVYLDF